MRIRTLSEGVRGSDLLLVVGLVAVNLAQVVWVMPIRSPSLPDSDWIGPVLAVVSTVPLLWRRTRPVMAAVVGSAFYAIPTDAFLFLGYVIAILLFYSLGRWTRGWFPGLIACAWALAAGTVGTLLGEAEDPVPGVLGVWLVVLASYLAGRLMAAQSREAEVRLEAEREVTRRQAAAEERARIIRELHDVVGHEVTLMSIQSEAAAQALAVAPERAAEPVAAVRETAHRTSRELRAMLDLLGEGEDPAAPDQRGFDGLTQRAARFGIPNRPIVSGTSWEDAPRHWLAVNRIVQECLTNAGKHAPGQVVEIALDWSADGVALQIGNTAERAGDAAPGTGRGLPGMAERARLLGGTFEAGHVDDRFEVAVWLPADDSEAGP